MVPIEKVFALPELTQGDDCVFSIRLGELSAADYTLSYVFKRNGLASFTITSTNNTGEFLFSVICAVTSTYTPGNYYVAAYLIDGTGLKTTIGQSELCIKPNLASDGLLDPRSHYKQMFDDVEEALMAGAGSDVVEYSIAGTTMRMNRESLLKLRAFTLQRVKMEMGISAIGTINFYL
jgi:hypothetical protein